MMKRLTLAVMLALLATPVNAGSTSLNGVVEPLKSKAAEIVRDCGSKIVSSIRKWGATPNHRQGRAVDIQGNPACIYAKLKNWPGGVSTDYHTAPGGKHVHVSYSRRHEWGLRFAHARSKRPAHRVELAAKSKPPAHP